MFPNLLSILTAFSVMTANAMGTTVPVQDILASHGMPMNDRYGNAYVADVFKKNILLTMAYMDGSVKNNSEVDWNKIEAPFTYSFTLNPGQTFAYHDQVLPQYVGKITKTTNAHFDSSEGFVSDGYLVADGVCHLASLINWVSRDANLDVNAPTNHDFAKIPDIARQYGTAIYDSPDAPGSSQLQNLYVTNNKNKPVEFLFTYKNDTLYLSILEEKAI